MTLYIVSVTRQSAIRHTGGTHHMTLRAAASRFAPDALVVRYSGFGHIAADVLKLRSAVECHLSTTERELIALAG